MRGKLLVAMFGGAILGAILSRRIPPITVIVNAGNQGSIDIKVDNTTSDLQNPDQQLVHGEHMLEISGAEGHSEAKPSSDLR